LRENPVDICGAGAMIAASRATRGGGMTQTIAFIGMGEAGGAIVDGWRGAHPVCAFDLKSDDPATAGQMAARYADLGIAGATCPAEAVAGAEAVFCTVTADQAVVAAKAAAPHLRPGTLWFDLNSCAPSSKRQAAEIIEAAGARYVDVAVMAPVYPKQNMVPLLVSGPHATVAASVLAALPMNPRVVEGAVGAASSIKMIRSIMVKGLEALTAECTLAAVAAGVEEEVFGSLLKSHPGTDWPGQAAYNFERAMVHGARRAAEMEEVAKTVADIGLPQDMSRAVVQWQRRIAGAGLPAPEDAAATGPRALALALLDKLRA
jgi:3-hydroxyisobutyrate dehydrogenase-like beta-hydroxyacid dehydrogenase